MFDWRVREATSAVVARSNLLGARVREPPLEVCLQVVRCVLGQRVGEFVESEFRGLLNGLDDLLCLDGLSSDVIGIECGLGFVNCVVLLADFTDAFGCFLDDTPLL
jgi:hypothetical protein